MVLKEAIIVSPREGEIEKSIDPNPFPLQKTLSLAYFPSQEWSKRFQKLIKEIGNNHFEYIKKVQSLKQSDYTKALHLAGEILRKDNRFREIVEEILHLRLFLDMELYRKLSEILKTKPETLAYPLGGIDIFPAFCCERLIVYDKLGGKLSYYLKKLEEILNVEIGNVTFVKKFVGLEDEFKEEGIVYNPHHRGWLPLLIKALKKGQIIVGSNWVKITNENKPTGTCLDFYLFGGYGKNYRNLVYIGVYGTDSIVDKMLALDPFFDKILGFPYRGTYCLIGILIPKGYKINIKPDISSTSILTGSYPKTI